MYNGGRANLKEFQIHHIFPRTKDRAYDPEKKLASQDARRSGKDLNEDPWEAERKRIRHCLAMAAFRQCDWDFYEQVVPRNKSYCKRSPWAATCESISRPVQGGPACKFGENHERKGSLALPVASSHSTPIPFHLPLALFSLWVPSPWLAPWNTKRALFGRLQCHREDAFCILSF